MAVDRLRGKRAHLIDRGQPHDPEIGDEGPRSATLGTPDQQDR